MLNQIKPEEILFLDIETVPQNYSYEELNETDKSLWFEKSKFTRERRNMEVDESYQEAGIYAEFGKIVCISVGYFVKRDEERLLRLTSFFGDDEKQILEDFASLLNRTLNNPFRLLCAHNGKEFDFPYICRRMLIQRVPLPSMLNIAGKKPWEISHLDTMELWKFGDYKHYTSLKLLARVFGIPTPKDDIDGSQVREVYYEEKNLDRIEVYCRKDVATVANVLLSYLGEPIVSDQDLVIV
jgi:uncharacterized protein YprB with RNaseH-like and TPR domain